MSHPDRYLALMHRLLRATVNLSHSHAVSCALRWGLWYHSQRLQAALSSLH